MESVMKLNTILVLMVVASAWLGAASAAGLIHFTQKVTSGDTSCLQSIETGCSDSDTDASCCTALNDAADNHVSCFCLLQPALVQEGVSAADIATIFTTCGTNGSFDTLCSSGSTPTSTTGSTPVDNPSPPSTTTSTGGGFGGLGGGKNAGNKLGMKSLSSFLVLLASAMIIRGI